MNIMSIEANKAEEPQDLVISLRPCRDIMIDQFYTNHTFNSTFDSFLAKNDMDGLVNYSMKQIDYKCSKANSTKIHEVLTRHKENAEIAKELLSEITAEERFQLKEWILLDDMTSITEFMLEKMIVWMFSENRSKVWKLLVAYMSS